MPFVIGETVGTYQLVEQLGSGGMALVFKAYHPRLDRFVAIKVLHAAFTDDGNFLARFQREARVVAQLDHANIVPIYDYSEYEGRPYLVMKFIEGDTLKARMESGPLTKPEIIQIVDKIGSALSYAHAHNVLHRDIKPSNVLISKDGQIYLADFGLARIAQSSGVSLTSDRFVGTSQYISPEQAMSKSDLDARTDIYSFGVMLYEMLVGQVPYNADTPFAIIHDHIYSPLPLPRQVNPQVSDAEQLVLLKALAKNPDDRFADVNAMVNAFHAAEEGQPTAIPGAGEIYTLVDEIPVQPVQAATPGSTIEPASAAPPTTITPIPKPPVEVPEKRSASKTWIIGGTIAALLALLIICMLLVLPGLQRFRANNAAQKTALALANAPAAPLKTSAAPTQPITKAPVVQASPTVVIPPTATPIGADLAGAQKYLDVAISDWMNGDVPTAEKDLVAMQSDAGETNQVFAAQAVKYLMDKQAWLLAAMVIFENPGLRPVLTTTKKLQEPIHQILYRAAGDKLAGPFFTKFGKHPFFVVADVRYELFYGDPVTANNQLTVLLSNPVQLAQFPEARLLEIESRQHQNDLSGAQQMLQTLQAQSQLPVWIQQMAAELATKLNTK
jgi:serine/threonine protein kinase